MDVRIGVSWGADTQREQMQMTFDRDIGRSKFEVLGRRKGRGGGSGRIII